MEQRKPVVVVGAGPAGIAAALAAAKTTPTVLVDEGTVGGDHDALVAAGVEVHARASVWGLFPGPSVAAFDAERAFTIDGAAVVIATGAIDRTWPVTGWHLDGVVTAGEVSEGNARYGVIGVGDHARDAAGAIEAAGGTVAIVTGIADARIEGDGRVERLDGTPVDRVVLALGRRPDPVLALGARAASAFVRDALIAMPLLAADGATSLPGVFVAGEAAGFAGIDAARQHGERAGVAAAAVASGGPQSAGLAVPAVDLAPLPLPADLATIIDREQGVDLATVQAAIRAGAWDVNDLRRRTRAGMGVAGAREAMPVLAAALLAADPAIADDRLVPRERPPARPLPFRAVLEGVAS